MREPQTSPRRGRERPARGRGWLFLAIVGLAASAALYAWRSGSTTTLAEAPRETVRVGSGSIERTVIATGVIRPVVGAEINVGSRISGTVVELAVEVGDRVEAGQLLAALDETALEAAVDEAQAELALARPVVALARATLDRRRRLTEDGVTSGEDLEVAIRDLAVAEARVAASEARLRTAEIVLGYCWITAPIAGVIAEVSTREGETVAADFSAPTFVTVLDLDRLEVLAYVDETDIGRVFVGQSATFRVDTYPDATFVATVRAIKPRAELEGSVVNYGVRLDFESPDGYVLRPEMTAHVRIELEERQGVVTVPREALRRRDGRVYVLVEEADDWREREVELGWRDAGSAEIVAGLVVGDVIALHTQ